MTRRRFVVDASLAGERADKVVAELAEVARSVSRAAFDAGGVVRGGVSLRPADRVDVGDTLEVDLPDSDRPVEPDASVPFTVVHQDPDVIVVDKPIGVVVHPTSSRSTGTLVHGLIARYPEVVGVGEEGRWGIVHRLDRDTSGLLVVARTDRAHRRLTEAIRERVVERRYLTLVTGTFAGTRGTIDAPIARDPRHPTRVRLDRDGRRAVTHYRRLAGWVERDASLLSVTLETGRTHQIRVHLRAIDHPIVGDRAYGSAGQPWDPGRPWLHARELRFPHPVSGDVIRVVAPLPDDLVDSLAVIGPPDVGDLVHIDEGAP